MNERRQQSACERRSEKGMKMKKRERVDEDNRKLSPAEQRRLERLHGIEADLAAQGYKETELTISIVKANVFVLVMAVPLFIGGLLLFFLLNDFDGTRFNMIGIVAFLVVYFALIVVHELVHGITWSLFCENGFKDIEFGVMWQMLTPYCTCGTPLKKGHYILGGLMPLIVLGIIPTVIAYIIGSLWLLIVGLVMILSAGGDILICWKLVRYKADASEVLIYDHPTKGGSIIFEK